MRLRQTARQAIIATTGRWGELSTRNLENQMQHSGHHAGGFPPFARRLGF
jgi:hypothetical protein